MKFLGIYREPEYSPGRHTSNDALILQRIGEALERFQVPMSLVSLEEARNQWQEASLIFSMCQGPKAIAELQEWRKQGALILNDPAASRRTYRDTLCVGMRQNHIPFPRSAFLPTDGSVDLKRYQAHFENGGAWLKRADVHATQAGDVAFVNHLDHLSKALETFHQRGLAQAVLQENIVGDEVKFYAVQGGRFFWPYYPKDGKGYPFDENALQAIAESAAKILEISIFGGDAIISPEGTITLIDVNDFPSFAPCRGAAAFAIANYLKDIYHAIQNSRETSVSL